MKPAHFSVAHILDHSFIPEFIGEAGVVLDCGSHKGEFAKWISGNTSATVHSFEADPRRYAALPVLDRVSFYNLAIDGESGEMEFFYPEKYDGSGVYYKDRNVGSTKVEKTSLDDFCESRKITSIDLIKMDIEGSELSTLMKTSEKTLRSVSQITVEFHDIIRKEDVPDIQKAAKRLESLGFFRAKFSRGVWSDCLFINTHRIPINAFDKISIFISGRLLPALNRRVFNYRLKLKNRIRSKGE